MFLLLLCNLSLPVVCDHVTPKFPLISNSWYFLFLYHLPQSQLFVIFVAKISYLSLLFIYTQVKWKWRNSSAKKFLLGCVMSTSFCLAFHCSLHFNPSDTSPYSILHFRSTSTSACLSSIEYNSTYHPIFVPETYFLKYFF